MRVVSLLPAATEMVAALGALPRLVGVSHECDYPPEARALPRVTRTRLDPSLPSAEIDPGLRYRLRRIRQAHAPGPTPPSVLVLEWLDPPYVAGHWVPELVEIAGGRDAAGRPGERSTARSWRELSALAPDLVVVAPCGFDVARAQQELAAVTDRDARALLGRRVEFMDGNAYTSRPGPRLVDSADIPAWLFPG